MNPFEPFYPEQELGSDDLQLRELGDALTETKDIVLGPTPDGGPTPNSRFFF